MDRKLESWAGRELPFDGWGAVAFDGWSADRDGRTLTIWWSTATFSTDFRAAPTLRIFSAEQADSVHVLAIDTALPDVGFPGRPARGEVHDGSALITRLPEPARVTVRLVDPIGDRLVIDAATGRPARRAAPPPIEPEWI